MDELEEIRSGGPGAAQRRLLTVQDILVLETTKSITKLAKLLLSSKAVPESCLEDALHIGIAAVQGMDFLLTCNFKHINNAYTRNNIARIIAQSNFNSPVLCSPEELIK